MDIWSSVMNSQFGGSFPFRSLEETPPYKMSANSSIIASQWIQLHAPSDFSTWLSSLFLRLLVRLLVRLLA
jgi:hypothetical protein